MVKGRDGSPGNLRLAAACALAFFASLSHAQLHLLVDQVGCETGSPEQALVLGTEQDRPQQFTVTDAETGKSVFTGNLQPAGKVYKWSAAWGDTYWIADFSAWKTRAIARLKRAMQMERRTPARSRLKTTFSSAKRSRT